MTLRKHPVLSSATRAGFSAALLALILGSHASGDELLRTAQRELRARKLYFGPIDGRESAASTAAIQRLQALKGIDQSGQLDGDTQRALGFRSESSDPLAEKGCAILQQYLAARAANDADHAMGLFAETIDYFDDGLVDRAFVRDAQLRENERWSRRHYTLINRIVTANPTRAGEVIITARIRTEVSKASGRSRALTEDVAFTLREVRGALRIVSLKRID